jgi:hypothetical protein
VITVKNGAKYEGIFSGASTPPAESAFVIKMTRQVKLATEESANGVLDGANEYIGVGEEHTMIFESKDVVDVAVSAVSINDTSSRAQNGMRPSYGHENYA